MKGQEVVDLEWYENRKNTFLQRLDPRLKEYLFLLYLFSTWLMPGLCGLLLPLGAVLLGILLAQVPLKRLVSAMAGSMVGCLILFLLLWILLPPLRAGRIAIKILDTMLAAYLLTATIRCMSFLDGLLFGFKIRRDTALNLLLWWNLIPLLRGILRKKERVSFYREPGNGKISPCSRFFRRCRLFIPAVSEAFRESHELKRAMHERGYDAGQARVPMKGLSFQKRDIMILLGMAAYVALSVLLVRA